MEKLNPDLLNKLKENTQAESINCIKVGMSTCGLAAGSAEVYNVLEEEISKRNLPISLKKCGCVGMCFAEPMIEVKLQDMPTVFYGKINKDVALKIVEDHLVNKKLVDDHIFTINV